MNTYRFYETLQDTYTGSNTQSQSSYNSTYARFTFSLYRDLKYYGFHSMILHFALLDSAASAREVSNTGIPLIDNMSPWITLITAIFGLVSTIVATLSLLSKNKLDRINSALEKEKFDLQAKMAEQEMVINKEKAENDAIHSKIEKIKGLREINKAEFQLLEEAMAELDKIRLYITRSDLEYIKLVKLIGFLISSMEILPENGKSNAEFLKIVADARKTSEETFSQHQTTAGEMDTGIHTIASKLKRLPSDPEVEKAFELIITSIQLVDSIFRFIDINSANIQTIALTASLPYLTMRQTESTIGINESISELKEIYSEIESHVTHLGQAKINIMDGAAIIRRQLIRNLDRLE